jgi:prepilin-type N-terminal cleavage/methylation domain-containing protein
MRGARGFTMMEAAVTLAIVGIISVAALSLHSSIGRSFSSARRLADLSDRVLGATTYLAKELTTVGGNTSTASMSIFVENACAARGDFPACPNGSDRITLFAAVPKTPACRVSHVDASVTPPRVAFWFRDIEGIPRCCLNDEKNGVRFAGDPPTQFLKRHAIINNGPFRKPMMLIADATAPGFTTAPAPPSYSGNDSDGDGFVDSRCTFRMLDVVPPALRTEPPNANTWVDGSISIVDMRTLYIDDREAGSPPMLMLHTDMDKNAAGAAPTTTNSGTGSGPWGWTDAVSPPQDETILVADGVYDLQLSLGYDFNGDDVVSASEWIHDQPGETRDLSQDRRLRLLRFDIVLGIPSRTSLRQNVPVPTPARDGGATLALPGVALRAASVTVIPRNSDSLLAGID